MVWAANVDSTGSAATLTSVKDGNGNSYTITPNSPSSNSNTTGFSTWMAYIVVPSGVTSETVTGTWSSGIDSNDRACYVDEFRKASGTPTFDQDAATSNYEITGTTVALPCITPALSGELMYGSTMPAQVITHPTAGATLGVWTGATAGISTGETDSEAEYLLSSGASSTCVEFTDNTSGDYVASMVAAFK